MPALFILHEVAGQQAFDPRNLVAPGSNRLSDQYAVDPTNADHGLDGGQRQIGKPRKRFRSIVMPVDELVNQVLGTTGIEGSLAGGAPDHAGDFDGIGAGIGLIFAGFGM